MTDAIKLAGVWTEIGASGIEVAGLRYQPGYTFSGAERTALTIATIVEPDPPSRSVTVLGSNVVDVDGMPHRIYVTEPADLATLKRELVEEVNAAAGSIRKGYITDIAGQEATYLTKEQEARAWTANADPAGFPYLAAEAAATNMTIDAVAALVIATADAWRLLDAKLEGKRRGLLVAIDAAEDGEAALSAADDPAAALTAALTV